MNLFSTHLSKKLATAIGATVIGLVPSLVAAHPHFFDLGIDVPVVVTPAPVVVDHTDRVWVDPVYRTVTERVWVAPVVEDRDVHTWVPDRFEVRDVEVRQGDRHYWTRQRVLVEPGHDVCQRTEVEVAPGHWEDVQRQELVTSGHWEYATEYRDPCPAPAVRVDFFDGWFHHYR
jgi:hypothetical protein